MQVDEQRQEAGREALPVPSWLWKRIRNPTTSGRQLGCVLLRLRGGPADRERWEAVGTFGGAAGESG
jgi:hypothetical protein